MRGLLVLAAAALLPLAAHAQGIAINQLPLYGSAIGNIVLPGMIIGAPAAVGNTVGITVGTGGNQLAAGNDSRILGALQGTNNLSDLGSPTTARINLGLGGAAVLNVGTAAGTVAAGNDSRVVGALQGANNLSDVANVATALTNLGLGTANSPTFGGLTLGGSGTNAVTVNPGSSSATAATLSLSGSGGLNVTGGQTINNVTGTFEAPYFKNPGNTTTLSGSTNPTRQGNFSENYAGSSTITGNTTLANVSIASSSYNASAPNGIFDELLISGNTGASFDGGLEGIQVQLALNAATTLSKSSNGIFGYLAKVIGNANAGGVTAGFGTTQFGLGAVFGANPWATLTGSGTYYNEVVGEEVDASIGAGASASRFAVDQLVLTSDHAVHGTNVDAMLVLGAQVGAGAGVRNLIAAGDYTSQFPLDPNGYIFQIESGETTPASGAGGFDLNQLSASGSGTDGGGFYWRSPGVQIIGGALQIGNGLLSSNGAGLVIGAPYEKMSAAAGAITVGAGGTAFSTGDLACDAYGDCVKVTASSGAVTGVSSIVSTGWQTSPPSNPVAFTVHTRTGSAYGSGLTLNLSWTAANSISFSAPPQLPQSTVAALPSCVAGLKGAEYGVTDATSPSWNGALTGGGSVAIKTYCNGSAWVAG